MTMLLLSGNEAELIIVPSELERKLFLRVQFPRSLNGHRFISDPYRVLTFSDKNIKNMDPRM